MNLRKIFGNTETITTQERQQLEALEQSCSDLKKHLDGLPNRLARSKEERKVRLHKAALDFAEDISHKNFENVLAAIAVPAESIEQDFEAVAGAIRQEIENRMKPQTKIIEQVLRRHLLALEKRYESTMAKETKEASEFGVEFKPSGIVRGLESKILELRNKVHNCQLHDWRTDLAEVL